MRVSLGRSMQGEPKVVAVLAPGIDTVEVIHERNSRTARATTIPALVASLRNGDAIRAAADRYRLADIKECADGRRTPLRGRRTDLHADISPRNACPGDSVSVADDRERLSGPCADRRCVR